MLLALITLIALSLYFLQKDRNPYSKKFKNLLKKRAMGSILKAFGDIEWRKHDKNIAIHKTNNKGLFKSHEIDKSGLFIDFNEQYIDDEFLGTYKVFRLKFLRSNCLIMLINRHIKHLKE